MDNNNICKFALPKRKNSLPCKSSWFGKENLNLFLLLMFLSTKKLRKAFENKMNYYNGQI